MNAVLSLNLRKSDLKLSENSKISHRSGDLALKLIDNFYQHYHSLPKDSVTGRLQLEKEISKFVAENPRNINSKVYAQFQKQLATKFNLKERKIRNQSIIKSSMDRETLESLQLLNNLKHKSSIFPQISFSPRTAVPTQTKQRQRMIGNSIDYKNENKAVAKQDISISNSSRLLS